MFTGIIRQLGTIEKVLQEDQIRVLRIAASLGSNKEIGDSIAVDGACLTVAAIYADKFEVKAIPETIKKTIIKNYKPGTIVNLEDPLKIGDSLHGHMVQGHVDFVAEIKNIKNEGASKRLEISFDPGNAKYFALKGSVTVNGVSLTISKLGNRSFEVSLIPQTLIDTNLGQLQLGSAVNIEIDIISRYLESLLKDKAQQTNYEFLQERGFI